MPRLKPISRKNVSKAISNEQFDDYFSDEEFDYDFESDNDYPYDEDYNYIADTNDDYSTDAYLDKRSLSKKKKKRKVNKDYNELGFY